MCDEETRTSIIDKIVMVCAALCNLMFHFVYLFEYIFVPTFWISSTMHADDQGNYYNRMGV